MACEVLSAKRIIKLWHYTWNHQVPLTRSDDTTLLYGARWLLISYTRNSASEVGYSLIESFCGSEKNRFLFLLSQQIAIEDVVPVVVIDTIDDGWRQWRSTSSWCTWWRPWSLHWRRAWQAHRAAGDGRMSAWCYYCKTRDIMQINLNTYC